MYLFIFEHGVVQKSEAFNDEDKASCDAGILEVIMLDPVSPKTYFRGTWVELETVAPSDHAG